MQRVCGCATIISVLAGAVHGQATPTWTRIDAVNLHTVEGMIVHDEDGSGPIEPYLVASGGGHDILPQVYPPARARTIRMPVNGVAKFDGFKWSAMGGGLYGSSPQSLEAANGFVSGDVPGLGAGSLLAHGSFRYSGGVPVRAFVNADRLAWHSWTIETGSLEAVTFCAAPGARPVLAMNNGRIGSGAVVSYPAMWDGHTLFVPDGGILSSPTQARASAFRIFDEDGDGPNPPRLFIGGNFNRAGTHWAHNVCRWDGEHLTALGGGPGVSAGPGNNVYALEVYDDDGPGPRPSQLYALGDFTIVYDHGNALPIWDLARWDGKQWSAVPGWEQLGNAYDMAVFDDDGPGPNKEALYIAGLWPQGDGLRGNGIIKWDGVRWHVLGSGLTSLGPPVWAHSLCVYDDDGAGANPGGLYVGGIFTFAGSELAPGFARWGIPLPEPCYADCDRAGTGYRVLDIFDFLCFQTRFAAGDPYACDADTSTGPRVCDLFDFLYFQNAFAAGCP